MRARNRRARPGAATLREEAGLRAAYRAHGAELYRFARRRLGDESLARDVVQETFLRAWRSGDRFDPAVASLRVWLFAIARNVVVDEARRRAARPAQPVAEDELAALAPADPGVEDAWMTTSAIEEALRRINPEQRSALVETYLRGRPYAEVAAEQAVPVGTLRSRVFYGLKALRLALDEMGLSPEDMGVSS